jgi:hypothetical protein
MSIDKQRLRPESRQNGPDKKVKHPTPPPNPAVAEGDGSRLSITKPADGDFAPHRAKPRDCQPRSPWTAILRPTGEVSRSRFPVGIGAGSSLYGLIDQSAQGQTGSGVEFHAANPAIMVRIGSLEAQLNNRQVLIFGQHLILVHACACQILSTQSPSEFRPAQHPPAVISSSSNRAAAAFLISSRSSLPSRLLSIAAKEAGRPIGAARTRLNIASCARFQTAPFEHHLL